jgi:Xaa-Pro aminopeptidase
MQDTAKSDTLDISIPFKKRLLELRALIRSHGLDAYWIPSQDEHLNEYVPEDRKRRARMSGFDGSAGDLLVTLESTCLFVDSRYHEQAEQDVAGLDIQVNKLGLEGHLTLVETLKAYGSSKNSSSAKEPSCQETFRVGVDPFTITLSTYRDYLKQLKRSHVLFSPVSGNLVDEVLAQVPDQVTTQAKAPVMASEKHLQSAAIPKKNDGLEEQKTSALYFLPETLSGLSPAEKLAALREKMLQQEAQWLPITKLDQIAWLFNLRGQDIPYNPVFIAYALISLEKAWLFVAPEKVSPELATSMAGWVDCRPYDDFFKAISVLGQKGSEKPTVLIDPASTTWGTYQELGSGSGILALSPLWKVKTRWNFLKPVKTRSNKAA